MSDTALMDGPPSTEVDDFLDEALGSAADESDDSRASELGSESDSTTDEQDDFSDLEEDAAALEEDADEDEDEEQDASAPEPDDEDDDEVTTRLTAAERRAQEAEYALEQERAAIRQGMAQLQEAQKAAAVTTRLNEMRARMTEEEWTEFSAKLTAGFQQHESQQKDVIIQQLVQQRQWEAFQVAEGQAHNVVMNHAHKLYADRGWTMTSLEEDYLLSQPNAPSFKAAYDKLEARREALIAKQRDTRSRNMRDTRRANGADRGSVKGTGGARGATKTYDNFNPETGWDEYVDDVFASR